MSRRWTFIVLSGSLAAEDTAVLFRNVGIFDGVDADSTEGFDALDEKHTDMVKAGASSTRPR